MRKTKDQKELQDIFALATDARDAAYSLFSRRLDTQRNVESFIGLIESFNLLKAACEILQTAVDRATETKSSNQYSVCLEIAIRNGSAIVIQNSEKLTKPEKLGIVLQFPTKPTNESL